MNFAVYKVNLYTGRRKRLCVVATEAEAIAKVQANDNSLSGAYNIVYGKTKSEVTKAW